MDGEGAAEPFATHLGVSCGLAFAADGTLFVGDRSGQIFKVDREGKAATFASLPASVAAFHLALGPDGGLFVTGPTLSTSDQIYRIDADGSVTTLLPQFGRPQGLALDPDGVLFVVEALAGASGLYRIRADGTSELVLSQRWTHWPRLRPARRHRRLFERYRLSIGAPRLTFQAAARFNPLRFIP